MLEQSALILCLHEVLAAELRVIDLGSDVAMIRLE